MGEMGGYKVHCALGLEGCARIYEGGRYESGAKVRARAKAAGWLVLKAHNNTAVCQLCGTNRIKQQASARLFYDDVVCPTFDEHRTLATGFALAALLLFACGNSHRDLKPANMSHCEPDLSAYLDTLAGPAMPADDNPDTCKPIEGSIDLETLRTHCVLEQLTEQATQCTYEITCSKIIGLTLVTNDDGATVIAGECAWDVK